jgi:Mrp family chromosome partitioning ATPase
MSRIDQAWRIVEGGAVPPAAADRATVDETLALRGFPQEENARKTPDPVRPRPRTPAPDSPFAHATVAPVGVRASFQLAPLPLEAARQFHRLGESVERLLDERGQKALIVTSAQGREGRSFTASHLAARLSEAGNRVLLVDGDVRSPRSSEALYPGDLAGLSDVLLCKVPEIPLLPVSGSLSLVPAGRPDPRAMASLTSDRLEDVLLSLADDFDRVVFDFPPVVALPDIRLSAALVRAVLLVVRAQATTPTDVERAIKAIGSEWVLGTVLNGVRTPQHG